MIATRPPIDLSAALRDVTQVLLPRLPIDPSSSTAQIADVTLDELATLGSSGDFVAVAVRVSGAMEGDLVLSVRSDATVRLGAADAGVVDAVAAWGDALGELVSALSERVGPLLPEAVRQIELDAMTAPTADAQQLAVAVVDGERRVALLVFSGQPATLVPQQRATQAPAFEPFSAAAPAVDPQRLHILRDVVMGLSVELGRTRMTVRELLSLTPGTIVQLDRAAGSPVDLLVNGTLIARGEVVVVDEEFAVRVSEIVGPDLEGRLGA